MQQVVLQRLAFHHRILCRLAHAIPFQFDTRANLHCCALLLHHGDDDLPRRVLRHRESSLRFCLCLTKMSSSLSSTALYLLRDLLQQHEQCRSRQYRR